MTKTNYLMKHTFWLFCSVLVFQVQAQNLLRNPNLEDYHHLPDWKYEYGEQYRDSFICKYWYKVEDTTPDYFHINAVVNRYGVPDNMLGHHPVQSDSAYIGFVPFTMIGAIEPIAGEFKKVLVKGKRYKVSFSYRFARANSYFYLNKLDCLISKKNWVKKYAGPMPGYTEIVTPAENANVLFTDTLNNDGEWHRISGSYIAQGGECFISLGIFYQNKKLYRIIDRYVDENFCFGDKDELETRLLRKYRKYLQFIHRNPDYAPKEKHSGLEVTMETEKEKVTKLSNERYAYYFIDNVSVEIE